jgi:hypothetical protein
VFFVKAERRGFHPFDGRAGKKSGAPPRCRKNTDFLRQWERCLWIAPANLQAAFLVEFNADRASKLADLLGEAVERGDLVQRAGLYFRTDQLTSWLNASDATA